MTNSIAPFLVEMGNEVPLALDLELDFELVLPLEEEEFELVVAVEARRTDEGLASGHKSSNLDKGSKTATGSSSS